MTDSSFDSHVLLSGGINKYGMDQQWIYFLFKEFVCMSIQDESAALLQCLANEKTHRSDNMR